MVVVYSYLFVFAVIGLSALFTKIGWLNDEGARKFIHIGVGNWIIIAYFLFDNIYMAVIPPATFILMNYLSFRFDLVKAMERNEKTIRDLGTVYYAVSLTIVVLADFLQFDKVQLALMPILVMAYADGLCAVVGSALPSRKLVGNKTLYGVLTMFLVTIVITVILGYSLLHILILSIAATLIELYSPRGFDNLTVPLLLYVIAMIL